MTDIFDVLGLFNRPMHAIYGGIQGALDPNGSAAEGAWKGLTGEGHVTPSDILGLPETNPNDDWASWLAKGGLRLGVDVIGDPTTWLGGPIAKALASTAPAMRAGQYIRGTGAAKVLGMGSGNPELENLIVQLQREGSNYPWAKTAETTRAALEDALSKIPIDQTTGETLGHANVYGALERQTGDPVLDNLAKIVKPMQEQVAGQHDTINELLRNLNLPELASINEPGYSWMPHWWSNSADNAAGTGGRRLGEVGFQPDITDPMRKIVKWVEADASGSPILDAVGNPIEQAIGTMKGSGVVKAGDNYFINAEKVDVGGKPMWVKKGTAEMPTQVVPMQATLPEVINAFPTMDVLAGKKAIPGLNPVTGMGPLGSGTMPWLDRPVEALYAAGKQRQDQINFLKTMKELVNKKTILSADDPAVAALSNARKLNIPGLEDFAASGNIANRLENLAGVSGPGMWGGIEDLMKAFTQSAPGQTLKDFTNMWKHNILPLFPGYHAGNLVSNAFMMGQSGDVNPLMVIPRMMEGRQLVKGTLGDLGTGLNLQEEALLRKVIGPNAGSESANLWNDIQDALNGVGRTRQTLGDTGIGGKIADIGESIGKANRWGAQMGQSYIEDPARAGVFIDYLKKNLPENASGMSKQELGAIMDQAAQKAKDALLDYSASGMSPFMNNLAQIIPFVRWNAGITGQTANLAMTRPAVLGNTEKLLEAMFTPASDQEKALMPDWMAEQGPVKADLLAALTGQSDVSNPYAFLGRFIPQGNIEQMVKRPLDFFMSSLNPAIKAPYELLANKNSFKNQPIDALAGNAVSGLINPLVGGQYQLSGNTKMGYEAPATLDYLLSGILPGSRHLALANEVGRAMGLWDDPYKQDSTPAAGLAWGLSGGKVYPLDMAKALKNKQWEAQQEMNKIKQGLKRAEVAGDDKGINLYLQEMLDSQTKLKPWLESSS